MKWNEHIQPNTDSNLEYTDFLTCFCKEFNSLFPVRQTKKSWCSSPRNERITPGLINSCNTKSKFYRKLKTDPSKLNEIMYYRNKLKKLLNIAKRKFYTGRITNSGGNLRQIWNTLNMLISKKKQDVIPVNFTTKGILYTNESKLLENLMTIL